MEIPRNLPLSLPAPYFLLEVLITVSFALHILFVNLMVGGSILTLIFQIRGLQKKFYDHIAHEIAKTITVNKSLAVVLGVAPLLIMNTLYTMFFYSANSLTGIAWILVIPLVVIAFLLTYLHKYSWEKLDDQKKLHIAIGMIATFLFLVIPLIFLTNANLMLFPKRWPEVHGFLSALTLPNVFPRYFHFLAASLAVISLFMVWYTGYSQKIQEILKEHNLTSGFLKRKFYSIAFVVTLAQFLFGPLLLFTLPSHGISYLMLLCVFIGVILALVLLWFLWKEVSIEEEYVGRFFIRILITFNFVVTFMVLSRHIYREQALADAKMQMEQKTQVWADLVDKARTEAAIEAVKPKDPTLLGKSVFDSVCSACHDLNKTLIGPPITEIISIYKDNPEGIVAWSLKPGRKRPNSPPMSPMTHVKLADLKAVAKWMLAQKNK